MCILSFNSDRSVTFHIACWKLLNGARIDEKVVLIRLGLREVDLGSENTTLTFSLIHIWVHSLIQAKHHAQILVEVT